MKELERTKRISISAVLFLLIILIGVITFKKPKYVFEKDTATTLQKIIEKDHFISLKEFKSIDPTQYILLDVRSNFEYTKGHLKDAINISTHQTFSDGSTKLLRSLKNGNKTIIVYGENPDNADSAWMLLYQLGYENVKILCIETKYTDGKFQVKNYDLEKPSVNYAQIMQKAQSSSGNTNETKKSEKTNSKRVIPRPKKKKRVAEGGC
ncbi:MAG: rhodanese-like domain-containing protein [Flavobacteriaceae bacterium]|nr:rhodanese-like domain-containing protein [Flavobacteriaceae bacterium]